MKYERKFFTAAMEGDIQTIEKALADGFPVDHLSKLKVNQNNLSVTPGRTGLMWAAIEGQQEAVATLLGAGASPDIHEHTGLEAFSDSEDSYRDTWALTAAANQAEIFKYLFQTLEKPSADRLDECLKHAAEHGALEVVKLLVEEGVDINAVSSEGTTALMSAASYGHPRVVEFLILHGADVNYKVSLELGTAINQCVLFLSSRKFEIDRDGNEVEVSSMEAKLECLNLLLDAGADPNVKQAGLGYPLEQVGGNRQAAELLLDAGANPRLTTTTTELPIYEAKPDASPSTRLMAGIEASDSMKVAKALADGADVNEEDEDGHTPVMFAAQVGNLDVVKLLIQNGSDLNCWAQGDNVLNRAVYYGHRDVVEHLYPLVSESMQASFNEEDLRQGELRRLRKNDEKVEAFIEAVLLKPIEMVRVAIEGGVDVNGIGTNGQTALHYAAYYGKIDIIQLLFEAGADVNIRASEDGRLGAGATALHLASSSCYPEDNVAVIDLLLDAGADLNQQDNDGNTPIMEAVLRHSSFLSKLDVVSRLIAVGADLEIKNKEGSTALMLALFAEHEDVVQLLRSCGATDYGVKEVALYKASSEGDTMAVRELLSEDSIDVNLTRPLEQACYEGHVDIVHDLVNAGADVNAQKREGSFGPLLRAAYGGHLEVLKLLLEAGADVAITDAGYSALDYARIGKSEKGGESPWDEVIALLKNANEKVS